MFQTVALAVASDNATDFPETNIIQKLVSVDSYLANEQFKKIVGG
jgi:hypothetical protein